VTITKIKKTGDVFFVQYEENEDIKTLKTEDRPESSLVTAMDNVAYATMKLFRITDVPCKLQCFEWKDGEKAGSKCTLVSGETMFGQFKTMLPKVSTQEAENPEEGIDPVLAPDKDEYNRASEKLRDEAKRFLDGARLQRPLAFPQEGEEEAPKKRRKGFISAVADKAAGLFNQ
jgi:hypothetical protein